VANLIFEDWESVWVQHRYGDPYAHFQFTAAEAEPFLGDRWTALRFKPDDQCMILLAGYVAINGIIVTRQIAYTATTHAVQLSGKSITWWASKSSVESTTGSFDNQPLEQIFRKVLSYYPCGKKTVGVINPLPFKKCQCQPGETTWDFLERLCRVRGVVLGSDHLGNFLLIDDHPADTNDALVEGKNIIKMQCIISKETFYQKYSIFASTNGSDDKKFAAASEQEADVPGGALIYSHKKTPAEQPVWNEIELRQRAANEKLWHEGAEIEAHVTVPGWLKPSGGLWRVGETVTVWSPMAALKDYPLAIEQATFTQDSGSGTVTELKLVKPELLKVQARHSVGPIVGDDEPQNAPAGTEPTPPPATPEQVPLPPGTRLDSSGAIVEN